VFALDRALYASLARRASDLVDSGDRDQAIEIFEQLVASELPDLDRAYMCLNIATVYEQQGKRDHALEAFARAVDIERRTDSYYVASSRAAYYSQIGLYDESSRHYDDLLRHKALKPEDRDAFLQNIRTLSRLRR
jgi:tetratricopeptide (TPR) repeat protein